MEWVRVRNKVFGFAGYKFSKMALAINYKIILARLFTLSLSLSLRESIWDGENVINICLFTTYTFV